MQNSKTEQNFNPELTLIGFSGTGPWLFAGLASQEVQWQLLDHRTLKVAEYDTQFARVKPTNKRNTRLQLRSPPQALSPPLTTPPPPFPIGIKKVKLTIKCRRCGESAFYLHGPMNKQKSKQFACFQLVVMLHQTIIKLYFEPGVLLNIHVIL